MPSLTAAARAAVRATAASAARDDAIRTAHARGSTVREIAAAVGLSPARVHQILHHR